MMRSQRAPSLKAPIHISSTGLPDSALPRHLTCGLIGDELDPATQLLLFNSTAAIISNDGAADDESFYNVTFVRKPDAPDCDPNNGLVGNGFDFEANSPSLTAPMITIPASSMPSARLLVNDRRCAGPLL